MSSLGPKQHVFASLAAIAQGLGHAHRLEMLEHLAQGERSVEDLAGRAGITLANCSRHLQLLRRAGLVEGRREGKRVFYRLSGEEAVVGLLNALSRVGERNSAEIARVMANYPRSGRVGAGIAHRVAGSAASRDGDSPRCASRGRVRAGPLAGRVEYTADAVGTSAGRATP